MWVRTRRFKDEKFPSLGTLSRLYGSFVAFVGVEDGIELALAVHCASDVGLRIDCRSSKFERGFCV